MKKTMWVAGMLALGCSLAQAAENTLPEALRKEAQAAIAKGLTWLAANQRAAGFWSEDKFPAMTALPLWAFAGAGPAAASYTSHVDKAVAFILSKAQPDGGIYVADPQRGGAGLGNYNTSLCMMGLHATGRKDVVPVIQKAREYTAATQLTGDDEHAVELRVVHADALDQERVHFLPVLEVLAARSRLGKLFGLDIGHILPVLPDQA